MAKSAASMYSISGISSHFWIDIESFVVGSISLWPQKVGSRVEIYSAKMEIHVDF